MKKILLVILPILLLNVTLFGCSSKNHAASGTLSEAGTVISALQIQGDEQSTEILKNAENSSESAEISSSAVSSDTEQSSAQETTAPTKKIKSDLVSSQEEVPSNSSTTTSTTQTKTTNTEKTTSEKFTTTTTATVTQTKTTTSTATTTKTTTTTKNPDTITVSLTVDCSSAVEYGDKIAQKVSNNGIILSGKSITLKNGATVFDALNESGLVIGSGSSAMGRYVYSIQSVAEKACGAKSGWVYTVNGNTVSESCSSYKLGDGDSVCWKYVCG